MLKEAERVEVTDEMKIKVANWALEKRAPFTVKNNSVGDALILLSAAEHRINKNRIHPNGFFVTLNHTDYAEKDNKDEIHRDLSELLEDANLVYQRHINKAMKDALELLVEIENWIDIQVETAKEERLGL